MKKHILISTLLFLSIFAFGQDTVFLNDKYEKIKLSKEASFYKTIKNIDSDKLLERFYLNSGQILSETEYQLSKNDKKIYSGVHKTWYNTGELRFVTVYENGKKNGEFLSYWKNGVLKRKDLYKNGKWKKGECWDENGKNVKYYDFEIHSKYPGGQNKMYKFIKKNIKYPPLSKKHNLGGRVVVDFKINKDGSIYDINISKGVNSELNNEAIRIIKLMPKWSPAFQDGIAVSVKYRIPIIFNP